MILTLKDRCEEATFTPASAVSSSPASIDIWDAMSFSFTPLVDFPPLESTLGKCSGSHTYQSSYIIGPLLGDATKISSFLGKFTINGSPTHTLSVLAGVVDNLGFVGTH